MSDTNGNADARFFYEDEEYFVRLFQISISKIVMDVMFMTIMTPVKKQVTTTTSTITSTKKPPWYPKPYP